MTQRLREVLEAVQAAIYMYDAGQLRLTRSFDESMIDAALSQPEPVGEPWGWAIEDKHGVAQVIRPARKEFFGCVQSTEPFTAEDIAKMDREWVGTAPHRIVTLHTRPAEQPAVPSDERAALQRIADWSEHPPMLGVDYGSNGVRDYYRKIARAALTAAPTPPVQSEPDQFVDANKMVAPVALRSVRLTRDTAGMCIVRVNGRVAIRDNGDIIDHIATLEWFAGSQPAVPEDVRRALTSAKRALENWCALHPDQKDALDTIAFEAIDAAMLAAKASNP